MLRPTTVILIRRPEVHGVIEKTLAAKGRRLEDVDADEYLSLYAEGERQIYGATRVRLREKAHPEDRPFPRTQLDERLGEVERRYLAWLEKSRRRGLPIDAGMVPGLVSPDISLLELRALGALIGRDPDASEHADYILELVASRTDAEKDGMFKPFPHAFR